ncbi:MAG: hypothetical protein ACFE0R_12075 [Salinarimonas sp.]
MSAADLFSTVAASVSDTTEALFSCAHRFGPTCRRATRAGGAGAAGDQAMTANGSVPAVAGAPDTARLAAGLRRFVAERLDAFACSEDRHDPRTTVRAVGDLTRCLKELVALERTLGTRGRASGEDEDDGAPDAGGDAATLAAGTAPRLADLVAREVERVHEPERAAGDLERL